MAVTNFVMKYVTAIFLLIFYTIYSIIKKDGKDLPWDQTKALLEKLGAEVKPPTGGGSHFKIRYSDRQSLSIPVHNGKIKKVYARIIANLIDDIQKGE